MHTRTHAHTRTHKHTHAHNNQVIKSVTSVRHQRRLSWQYMIAVRRVERLRRANQRVPKSRFLRRCALRGFVWKEDSTVSGPEKYPSGSILVRICSVSTLSFYTRTKVRLYKNGTSDGNGVFYNSLDPMVVVRYG